ncbi:MAG: restriction endonuclease subunit S [bacterium]|nr:restriction endonuclease subunit S [bacterium]
MGEWRRVPLGDVADLRMGQSPAGTLVTDLDRGLPFLQGNAEFGPTHPEATLECDSAPRRCARGDTLLSVRAPVGDINRSDQEYGIGRGLAAIRFEEVEPGFGHHALVECSRALHRVSQGTTFSAIGRSELESLELSVPPLEEQRRIAEILDTIDETIQASERIIAKSGAVRAGLASDLLGGGVGVAGRLNWKKTTLKEIALLQFGKTPSRSEARFWNLTDGYPWATIADMQTDPVLKTAETISEAGRPYAGRSVSTGSVLMSFKLTVGRVARAGTELFTNEAIVSVHGLDGRADDGWLYHALPGIARGGVLDTAVKGPTLNKEKLENLEVWLPPLEAQRHIAEILDAADYDIEADEMRLEKLRRLRSGLASDLLSGRVRTVAA